MTLVLHLVRWDIRRFRILLLLWLLLVAASAAARGRMAGHGRRDGGPSDCGHHRQPSRGRGSVVQRCRSLRSWFRNIRSSARPRSG